MIKKMVCGNKNQPGIGNVNERFFLILWFHLKKLNHPAAYFFDH